MLVAEIVIERPVKVVWAYFTKPKHWEKWWGGGLRSAEWRPGGRLEWALGGASPVEDVIPARKVRIRGAWMTTTWTFEPVGNERTQVRIQESDPRGGASFTDGGVAHLRQLNEALSRLKTCIESEMSLSAQSAQPAKPVSSDERAAASERLLRAAEQGDVDDVQAALQAGAEVDVRDREGTTPLGNAAVEGHLEIARLLLEYGASPNAQNIDGITPLMRAAGMGHVELVKLLIAKGADVSLKNQDGMSALDLARALGRTEVVHILEQPTAVTPPAVKTEQPASLMQSDSSESLPRAATPAALVKEKRQGDKVAIIVLGVVACLCLLTALLAAGGIWLVQGWSQATAAAQVEMTAAAHAQETATSQAQATGTAIAHATAIAKPTPTATPEQILILKDSFNYNINGWEVGNFEDYWWKGNAQIVDGKFRVEVQRSQGFVRAWWPAPELDAFNISLDAQLIQGSPSSACYGLTFRSQEDAYYLFKVCEDGRYTVLLQADGKWYTLIDWTVTRSIQYGQPNTLMVKGSGSHFEFYINGVLVNEMENSRLKKGHIGIAIDVDQGETSVFEFDNYILYSFIPSPTSASDETLAPSNDTVWRCGNLFELTLLSPIRFSPRIHDHVATGTFLIVEMQVLNLMDSKYRNLFEEDYQVIGQVNGEGMTFPASFSASYDLYYDSDKFVFFTDDILPGSPFQTAVAFDVDPNGTNWRLLFQPNRWTGSPDCSVEIPLQ